MTISTVIFDFGNVINRWEPERAVGALYPGAAQVDAAFGKHNFKHWVGTVMDTGKDIDASLATMKAADPERYDLIKCYIDNVGLAHVTPVPGTIEIIERLCFAGVKILGMSNCGVDAFGALRENFTVIKKMEDVFVSAVEKVCKPNPNAYAILLKRNALLAENCLFVDDKADNVIAAQALGMQGIVFVDATQLKEKLVELGLFNERPA